MVMACEIRLAHVSTAVDDEVGTGDPRGFVGGEIEDGTGNVFWQANATKRQASAHLRHQLTVLDPKEGSDFAAAKRILITATGDTENTGMGWKNDAKTSVGRDWGNAPVLVEGPAAKIELPGGGEFRAWALDERGQRRAEIPVVNGALEVGPQHRTLWYEVTRE